ncbi:MAG: FAD-dependent monooxygenase [Gammaproteobacteria bacterium]|nr:FAD-dependent monooxygenase [Gammaproteobacteria bacterium]
MSERLPAAVAGGGIVGLACALLLNRRCGWEVALVERSVPGRSGGRAPQRALTLSPGVAEVLAECGLRHNGSAYSGRGDAGAFGEGAMPLVPGGHAFSRMVVWRGDGPPAPGNSITFDAAELGVSALGCVAYEEPVRRALWELAEQCPGVHLHSGAAFESLEITAEHGLLKLQDGSEIAAELVVGADGGDSSFRQLLGIGFDSRGYGQRGLVFEAESDQSGGDTAWQRFVEGGTLALLPLGAGRWSIVWSLPNARAESLRSLDGKGLGKALNKASASVAGKLVAATPIASFPLRRGLAARICGERYALVGDAARVVHPLAGQGLNLGIGDVDALARVCAQRGSAMVGDARALARFARERARYGHEMSFGIHAINAAFSGPAAPLAARGMAAVDRLPPLKRQLAARAMR